MLRYTVMAAVGKMAGYLNGAGQFDKLVADTGFDPVGSWYQCHLAFGYCSLGN